MADSSSTDRGGDASPRSKTTLSLVLAVVILVPACVGFVGKFIDFIRTLLRSEADGRFTIIPIMNYLLVTAGFVCLLVWAASRGMFRDIESPKYTMLQREAELEEAEHRSGSQPR
jgi:hypothetical protein